MNARVLEAKTHRVHIERIHRRVEQALHRESERNVDVAHDRLDLRLRAAVMTVLDEELVYADEQVRTAEQLSQLESTFGAKA